MLRLHNHSSTNIDLVYTADDPVSPVDIDLRGLEGDTAAAHGAAYGHSSTSSDLERPSA